MIIEIKDLPKNQKIKRISFDIEFDSIDSDEETKNDNLISDKKDSIFPVVEKPASPENETITESLFEPINKTEQKRDALPIPPEMTDLEL